MPRGQPDFGMYAVKETVSGLADLGELAARLGSIVTFDRRGDVIWFDDFESDILKWATLATGAGYSIVVTAERARSGGFSCKMVTAAELGRYVQISRYLPYPVLSKMGFEIAFTYNSDMSEYQFLFDIYDGTTWYYPRARFLSATKELQVDDNGTWVSVATGIKLYETEHLFNICKLVVDFTAVKKYMRLILNEVEYDFSSYVVPSAASAIGAFLRLSIRAITGADSAETTYIDSAIVTQNEP